jgi:hypothetical protein
MEVSVLLHTPVAITATEKSPWHNLGRMICGVHSHSGDGGKEKNPTINKQNLSPYSSYY